MVTVDVASAQEPTGLCRDGRHLRCQPPPPVPPIAVDGHPRSSLAWGFGAGWRWLDGGEQFYLPGSLQIRRQDLLGVAVCELRHRRRHPSGPVEGVHHDPAGLHAPFDPVWGCRRGEDFGHPVAGHVGDLDLVDEGVRRVIDRRRGPLMSMPLPEHGNDTLIVGGDHDLGLTIAGHVSDLDVAEAVEAAPEVRAGDGDALPSIGHPPPEFHPRRDRSEVGADRENPGRLARHQEGHRLVKDVALGVLEHFGGPPARAVASDGEPCRARGGLNLACRSWRLLELGLGEKQRRPLGWRLRWAVAAARCLRRRRSHDQRATEKLARRPADSCRGTG